MPDIIIVGGGLAGLALADALRCTDAHVLLLEARDRLGGRIKVGHDGDHAFDLGPSWYWPGQPRIARLIADLGLTSFAQHAVGDLSFEEQSGEIKRGVGFSSMEGSLRVVGGMAAIIDGLARRLPQGTVRLNAQVTAIETGGAVVLSTGEKITATKVVLACPPRVAKQIQFNPAIDQNALSSIPTWMGGQAKFVATYDAPFWRDANLSGDAMSRRGPLVEIHDASPADATLGGLFGFVGVPTAARFGKADLVIEAALSQLTRLFGQAAGSPREVWLEDWAEQKFTADELDQQPLSAHPDYGLPHSLSHLWGGALHFGSTEVAAEFGGFLEGALARAEELVDVIVSGD